LDFSKIIEPRKFLEAASEQFFYSASNICLIFSVGYFVGVEALYHYTITILFFNLVCLFLNSTVFGYLNSRPPPIRESAALAYTNFIEKRRSILFAIAAGCLFFNFILSEKLAPIVLVIAISILEVHRRFGIMLETPRFHLYMIPLIRILVVFIMAQGHISTAQEIFFCFAQLCLFGLLFTLLNFKSVRGVLLAATARAQRDFSVSGLAPLFLLFIFGFVNWFSGILLLNKAPSYFSTAVVGEFLYLKNFFSIASFLLPIFENFFVKRFRGATNKPEWLVYVISILNLSILLLWSFFVFMALNIWGEDVSFGYAGLIFCIFVVELILSSLVSVARLGDRFVVLPVLAIVNLGFLLWSIQTLNWWSAGDYGTLWFLGQQNLLLVTLLFIYSIYKYGRV